VPGLILAQATSDNVPGGAILTFAFPIILFAVIATALYFLLFARPHPRVPAERVSLATATGGAPGPAAAHGAAVAAGMPTASGGGSAESAAEPHGAKRDALAAEDGGTGKVAGGTTEGSTAQGTTEGTEASE
jgi:hypothetical protein